MRSCEGRKEARSAREQWQVEEEGRHTFASLTLEARYGLPPRSGWFLRFSNLGQLTGFRWRGEGGRAGSEEEETYASMIRR